MAASSDTSYCSLLNSRWGSFTVFMAIVSSGWSSARSLLPKDTFQRPLVLVLALPLIGLKVTRVKTQSLTQEPTGKHVNSRKIHHHDDPIDGTCVSAVPSEKISAAG